MHRTLSQIKRGHGLTPPPDRDINVGGPDLICSLDFFLSGLEEEEAIVPLDVLFAACFGTTSTLT